MMTVKARTRNNIFSLSGWVLAIIILLCSILFQVVVTKPSDVHLEVQSLRTEVRQDKNVGWAPALENIQREVEGLKEKLNSLEQRKDE